MNVDLLLKIKERILAEPEHFDMRLFFEQTQCGTTACIAGWACALSRGITLEQADAILCQETEDDAELEGMDNLSLNERQASTLFFQSNWPQRFAEDYFKAYGDYPKRARIAAERIDHFLATDGRE